METRELPLVLAQDLHGVRERSLRTLYLHEHDPELFDDEEIECTVRQSMVSGQLDHEPEDREQIEGPNIQGTILFLRKGQINEPRMP
jgi:hypothetical protein